MTPERFLLDKGYTAQQISMMSVPQRRAAATRLNNQMMKNQQPTTGMQMGRKTQPQQPPSSMAPGDSMKAPSSTGVGMKPSNKPTSSQMMGGLKSSVARQKDGLLG